MPRHSHRSAHRRPAGSGNQRRATSPCRGVLALAAAVLQPLLGACAVGPTGRVEPTPAPAVPAAQPLPPLLVEVVEPPPEPTVRSIRLQAQDADLRALILALAEAQGQSIVLDPGVSGRITVRFDDVPADEALRAVLQIAGLAASTGEVTPPFGPALFYSPPVDIRRADAATLMARFGVSRVLAEWVVAAREAADFDDLRRRVQFDGATR